MDNEFILIDRLDAIRKTIAKYGEENFYLSFSGGKDSTVLHHLIDMAVPNNKIQRVFIDTGVEYQLIKQFVNSFINTDERFTTIRPERGMGVITRKYGWPFKSKEHPQLVYEYQNWGMSKTVDRYVNPPENRIRFGCPKVLKYQFGEGFDLKVSKKCCEKLKKEPAKQYEKITGKYIKLTGERKAEGALRALHGDCMEVDKNGNVKKFKPLNPVTDEWMEWFIKKYGVKLCELYYEPFNFKRTGCKGCPYNIKIENDLGIVKDLLPKEYNQIINMWKPVYKEYIRIKYRIKKDLYND